jgi:CRISPR-associated protein Cas2
MSETRMQYVMAYDTPDDRRRRRLAKCLNDYGRRVQYSVFEATLSRALFDTMVEEARALILPGEDRVHFYPLCAACAVRAVYLGQSAGEERPGAEMVFIV